MAKVRKNRVGEIFKNNDGETFTIIEYFNSSNITVKFDDGTIIKNRYISNINKGICKNPNYIKSEKFRNNKFLFNIGYLGIGKYDTTFICYDYWRSIFTRCYCPNSKLKYPTYNGCSVDERWHNFQVFAEWFIKNYVKNFEIDKNILIKGNKIYGPDTCCFVPHEINSVFTKANSNRGKYPIGVTEQYGKFRSKICIGLNELNLGTFNTIQEAFDAYKIRKELYIKSLADKHKNTITIETYNAMYNYIVEITD